MRKKTKGISGKGPLSPLATRHRRCRYKLAPIRWPPLRRLLPASILPFSPSTRSEKESDFPPSMAGAGAGAAAAAAAARLGLAAHRALVWRHLVVLHLDVGVGRQRRGLLRPEQLVEIARAAASAGVHSGHGRVIWPLPPLAGRQLHGLDQPRSSRVQKQLRPSSPSPPHRRWLVCCLDLPGHGHKHKAA